MKNKFAWGKGSKRVFNEVHPDMVFVSTKALTEFSTVDVGAICGSRTVAEQRLRVKTKASRTMASNHIPRRYKPELARTKPQARYKLMAKVSHATDFMAFTPKGKGTWESAYYYAFAEAQRLAAVKYDIPLVWGGCWKDLRTVISIKDAVDAYVEDCVRKGKSPFLDIGHYHLKKAAYS